MTPRRRGRVQRCRQGLEWAIGPRLRWLELQEELGCVLYEECGALILAGEGRSA